MIGERYLVAAMVAGERYRRPIMIVQAVCFAVVCAHYAKFIELPVIIAIPATVTAMLTGLRYAIWEGFLKPRVEARIAARSGGNPQESTAASLD